MSKGKKILLFISGVFIIVYLLLEINNTYPEKFKINDATFTLLKVKYLDSVSNCFLLTDTISPIIENDIILIAIRFELKHINVKHENIFNTPHAPWGALGHVDSIVSFKLFEEKNGMVLNDSLLDASLFKSFSKLGVVAKPGQSHHTSSNCYNAQTFSTIEGFVKYYNSNMNMYNLASFMEDYHFFKINTSLANTILEKRNCFFEIKFSDGFIVRSKI